MNQNQYYGGYAGRQNREELPYKRTRFNNSRSASPSPFRGTDNRTRRQDSDYHSSSTYNDKPRSFDNRNVGYQRRNENNFQDRGHSRYQNNQYSSYNQQFSNNPRPSNGYSSRNHQSRTRTEFPEQVLYEYGFLASPQRSQVPNRFSQLLDPTIGKNEVDDILANITSS